MIRLARCTQASKAGLYFRNHLATGDHPARPTTNTNFPLRAKWVGTALGDLGLVPFDAPTDREITRLALGLHPSTKTRLAPAVNRKRAYYDLTIAAPKTISLAALLEPGHPGAGQVMQCHVKAVEAVCGVIGRMIAPVRRGTPKIAKWVGVSFHHTHSRETDPHLHTHLVIPNLGKNSMGQWRAIQVELAGKNRNRLACTYAHELSRQLRRSGLGPEIVTRNNALPEIRSLRPLASRFSTATAIVQAIQTGLPPVPPTPGRPVELHSRSRLPVPPDRAEIQARRRKADEIRKPKRRASDDPVRLCDEARRWRTSLSNVEHRRLTALLDTSDPFLRSKAGSAARLEPLPPPAAAIIRAAYQRIQPGIPATGPVVFRAVIAESAGRHTMDDLAAATKAVLERKKSAKAKRRALHEADSLAAAQAYYATLNQPTRAATAGTTRTAQAPNQGAGSREATAAPSVESPVITPAAVPTTPTPTPSRGGTRR